jgi:hypothetical protein
MEHHTSVLGITISADDLMLTVTEEYERRNLRNKTGKKGDDAAFYSNDSGKEQKGGSSSKKNIKCHNCHKKGHYKSECWAPGGGKEGQGPKQKGKAKTKTDEKKETAAATTETKGKATAETKGKEKEVVEEAWLAMIDNSCVEENVARELNDDEVDWEELELLNNLEDTVSICQDVEEPNKLTVELTVTPIDLPDPNNDPFDYAVSAI